MGCEFLGRVAREFLGIIVSASLLEWVGSGRYQPT